MNGVFIMNKRQLTALKNKVAKLPPAPWTIKHSPVMGRFLDCGGGVNPAKAKRRLSMMTGPEELMKFAAEARVKIPLLIAEIERLKEMK